MPDNPSRKSPGNVSALVSRWPPVTRMLGLGPLAHSPVTDYITVMHWHLTLDLLPIAANAASIIAVWVSLLTLRRTPSLPTKKLLLVNSVEL